MAKRTRSQVGRLSCRKGKVFEREVVRRFRAAGIPAERGYHQARHGSDECDVVVPGLWVECGCGGAVTGEAKLAQAVEAEAAHRAAERENWSTSTQQIASPDKNRRLPLAVTRRSGQRALLVTLRFGDLSRIVECAERPNLDLVLPVTAPLVALLPLLSAWVVAHQLRNPR